MRHAPAILLVLCGAIATDACDGQSASDARALDAGPDAAPMADCGAGLTPYGSACRPRLDDCPGNQVPVPGGGCKRVGVEECDGGLKGPPDWTCKRIGVEECDGGLKGPPDWTCKPVGPPDACLTGWSKVTGGWCEPVLPAQPCAAGTMEVIGQASCQPVGPCGSGTWGPIVLTAQTVFVDESYAGSDADGSQARPWPTIGQALAAAPSGSHIAVAAGTYGENLVLDKALTLEGRCASQVAVQGQGSDAAVTVSADGVTLRGLSVSGPAAGLRVQGAKQVVVERVVLSGCGGTGAELSAQAGAALRDVLIEQATGRGVRVEEAGLTLQRAVVRDTQPDASQALGIGVDVAGPATVTVEDSVITRNRHAGLRASGATATVERSVISETEQPASKSRPEGPGIEVDAVAGPGTLTVRDSVVAKNRGDGIRADGVTVTFERSVLRDTKPRAQGIFSGLATGCIVYGHLGPGAATLVMKESLVTGIVGVGVALWGAQATVERSVVRDNTATSNVGNGGVVGVSNAGQPSTITVRDCLLAGLLTVGVGAAQGATVLVERTVVRDVKQPPSGPNAWAGIGVRDRYPAPYPMPDQTPSQLTVRDSLISGCQNFGISTMHSAARVERTRVVQTRRWSPGNEASGGGIANVLAPGSSSTDPPSKLDVSDCVLDDNTAVGLLLNDARSAVSRTLIQKTKVGTAGGKSIAFGVLVASLRGAIMPQVVLQDVSILDNNGVGLAVSGASASVERTVVRGTRFVEELGGMGIAALPSAVEGLLFPQSELTVRDSLVDDNRSVGVGFFNAQGVLERSVVRATRFHQGLVAEVATAGVYAGVPADWADWPDPRRASVTISDTILQGNDQTGLLLGSADATVQRVEVRETAKSPEGFGDGIAVTTVKGFSPPKLTLSDSWVEASARAGFFASNGAGSVERSVFRRGLFSVVLDGQPQPTVDASNVLEQNTEDRVTYGQNLTLPPIPTPPPVPAKP